MGIDPLTLLRGSQAQPLTSSVGQFLGVGDNMATVVNPSKNPTPQESTVGIRAFKQRLAHGLKLGRGVAVAHGFALSLLALICDVNATVAGAVSISRHSALSSGFREAFDTNRRRGLDQAEQVTMHPFRVAILIFLVGASVANYFAVKEYRDGISPVTAATVTPPGVSRDASGGLDWSKLKGTEAQSVTDPYLTKLETAANDAAWMRQAIIVTVAGVAWFLVRPKTLNE